MDMENFCFICSIRRSEFDRQSEHGYEHHVANEHNPWHYVAYIAHLYTKRPTEYTGLETFVYERLQQFDISWFPLHRALSLKGDRMGNEDGGDNDGDSEVQQSRKVVPVVAAGSVTAGDLSAELSDLRGTVGRLVKKVESLAESIADVQRAERSGSASPDNSEIVRNELLARTAAGGRRRLNSPVREPTLDHFPAVSVQGDEDLFQN